MQLILALLLLPLGKEGTNNGQGNSIPINGILQRVSVSLWVAEDTLWAPPSLASAMAGGRKGETRGMDAPTATVKKTTWVPSEREIRIPEVGEELGATS